MVMVVVVVGGGGGKGGGLKLKNYTHGSAMLFCSGLVQVNSTHNLQYYFN